LQDYEINGAGLSTFSLCSDDDDDDYYNEQSDDDDADDDDDDEGGGGDDNPFAPAEMYLSDLLDMGGGGGGRAHVYVPDSLVFSAPRLDPLYACALRSRLQELFSRNQDPEGEPEAGG
jgi:hypothetical protein